MTEVATRLVVHSHDREASQYLAAFILEHEGAEGTVCVELRLPPSVFEARSTRSERRVIVTLAALWWNGDPHRSLYSVSWLSTGNGRTPEFAGVLAVEKTPGEPRLDLKLNGRYESFGPAVDPARDRRIVSVLARDLLRSIANLIANRRARDDAAHAGHAPLAQVRASGAKAAALRGR